MVSSECAVIGCDSLYAEKEASFRVTIDFINMNDPLLDELFLATSDKNLDMKIIADSIRFIKENYIIPTA